MSDKTYDLIIVGAGVAGMTASIYASRYKISHLIFGETPGGQGMLAGQVENYPGYVSIPGPELMKKMIEQVRHYGVEIKQERVGEIRRVVPDGGGESQKAQKKTEGTEYFEVKTEKGVYQAKTLILALGASYRHLNIPGEEKFLGQGISYCVTCDIPLFRNKVVAVVGGGDSAVTGAVHAAAFAKKVFIIHRRDEYRAEPNWVEKMRKIRKVEEVLNNEVKEILGVSDRRLATLRTQNPPAAGHRSTENVGGIALKESYKDKSILPVDGVFIEVGQVPSSVLAKQLGLELDEQNYVKVNPGMATNIPGVFAAGDLAAIAGGILFRQFVTAASDGARAAASVYQYLHREAPTPSWGKR